jgi:hypothetical protein
LCPCGGRCRRRRCSRRCLQVMIIIRDSKGKKWKAWLAVIHPDVGRSVNLNPIPSRSSSSPPVVPPIQLISSLLLQICFQVSRKLANPRITDNDFFLLVILKPPPLNSPDAPPPMMVLSLVTPIPLPSGELVILPGILTTYFPLVLEHSRGRLGLSR